MAGSVQVTPRLCFRRKGFMMNAEPSARRLPDEREYTLIPPRRRIFEEFRVSVYLPSSGAQPAGGNWQTALFLKNTTYTSNLHIGSCSVTLMQVITFQEGSKWIVQQEAAGNVYQSFPRTVVDVLGETRNLQQSLLFVPEKMLFSGGDQAPD